MSHYLFKIGFYRSSGPEVFYKEGLLRDFPKFTGKHLYQSLFFNKIAQVFFSEFCQISKSNFFHRTPLVAASALRRLSFHLRHKMDKYWSRCPSRFKSRSTTFLIYIKDLSDNLISNTKLFADDITFFINKW